MQKIFWLWLTLGLLLCFASRSLVARSAGDAADRKPESTLLETGAAPKAALRRQPEQEIEIVSWNIRWRSRDELRRLAQLLKKDSEPGGAVILGLQEVDRNKKRSGNENAAQFLAESLGMYYAWAAPPSVPGEKEEETGVAILSAYPLTDIRPLVLPHAGPGGRRRVALGATVKLGRRDWRVYSVHAETRIPLACKLEQMKAVINDLARYPRDLPAIIMGDLNTWEPAAVNQTFQLFRAANFQTPFDETPTFFRRAWFVPIELKLDWIWLRYLESTRHGLNSAIKLSDHWPLWLAIKNPQWRGPEQ
jgi:endonuclease/exonuclease/phosphatase family metal-dependent hydrolase